MDPVIFLWIGGILIVVAVIVGIVLSVSSQRSAEEKRLDAFIEAGVEVDQKAEKQTSVFSDWLSKRVEKTTWSERAALSLIHI